MTKTRNILIHKNKRKQRDELIALQKMKEGLDGLDFITEIEGMKDDGTLDWETFGLIESYNAYIPYYDTENKALDEKLDRFYDLLKEAGDIEKELRSMLRKRALEIVK